MGRGTGRTGQRVADYAVEDCRHASCRARFEGRTGAGPRSHQNRPGFTECISDTGRLQLVKEQGEGAGRMSGGCGWGFGAYSPNSTRQAVLPWFSGSCLEAGLTGNNFSPPSPYQPQSAASPGGQPLPIVHRYGAGSGRSSWAGRRCKLCRRCRDCTVPHGLAPGSRPAI